MFYNYFEDYQYDSCTSKGICSIGPKTSSLQEVLAIYLRLLGFYVYELQKFGGKNKNIENVIINTITALMSNLETSDEQLKKILTRIKDILIESKKTYFDICKQKNIIPSEIKTDINPEKDMDIVTLIKLGEKEFSNRSKNLTDERKNLFEIIFFVIKSLCINIVELKEYDEVQKNIEKGFSHIIALLNIINHFEKKDEEIIQATEVAIDYDIKLSKTLNLLKKERYGEPDEYNVSLSTRPNKTILVAGSNIKELETVLEMTKNENIDIYTHGEMILAHSYPKFHEYKNLKGHFGIGAENCLLDFANFPGAILITKFAIENIEYLYRGRLFTTNSFIPKGVISISDDNFSTLIESAKSSKGFKRGKEKPAIKVGISLSSIENICSKINKYKKAIIILPENHTKKNKIYFKNLLNNIPKDTIAISFSEFKKCKNIINLNHFIDFNTIYDILDKIKDKTNISVFISKCDKHIISNLVTLSKLNIKNIFVNQCTPLSLKPILIKFLNKKYNIKQTTNASNDLKYV